MATLRDYQQRAVDSALLSIAGGKRTLIVLATGCGKTVCFAKLIERVLKQQAGKKALVLAHREELIYQAVDKIEKFTSLKCGVEMASSRADLDGLLTAPDVVVSTIQTQNAGSPPRMSRFKPSDFALVVVDESHHAVSTSYLKVLKHYTDGGCSLIGVTATPDRSDKEALGKVFDICAYRYDVADAVQDGWLVPVQQRLVQVTGLDYSAVRTTAGDLNGGDLAKVLEEEENLQRIASSTIQVVGAKKTLIFAASCTQAERLSEILNRYNAGCSHMVSGETDKIDRAKLVKDYALGRYQFIVNVGVFTEGFDDPGVEAVVMARPTKSRSLYAQMLGRGTRPSEEIAYKLGDIPTPDERRVAIQESKKPSILVLDFVGNSGRHKLVTAIDVLGSQKDKPLETGIIERAKAIALDDGKLGRSIDISVALEKAEEEAEEEKRRQAARRARLTAKASYSIVDVSPFFGTLGITSGLPSRTSKKLSSAQKLMLKKYGFKNVDKISYGDGKRLLDECIRRKRNDEPSYKQIKFMEKLGIPIPKTRKEATEAIGLAMEMKAREHNGGEYE